MFHFLSSRTVDDLPPAPNSTLNRCYYSTKSRSIRSSMYFIASPLLETVKSYDEPFALGLTEQEELEYLNHFN
jgi:hypothetical protein